MDCVTRSQTERMWAFDDPGVRDTDLVVTIDANAFVYNASSLNPVYNNPEKLIWVFQYQDTAAIPTGIGETFNQNFIVAYADVWRTIVDPGNVHTSTLHISKSLFPLILSSQRLNYGNKCLAKFY